MGRIREILPEQQRLCQQDPTSISCSTNLQRWLTVAELYTEAEAEYQRGKSLDGAHAILDGLALIRSSRMNVDPRIVLVQFRSVIKDKGLPLTFDRGLVDRIDSPAAARAFLRKLSEVPAHQHPFQLGIIASHASVMGDTDLALTTMRHSLVDSGAAPYILWSAISPAMRTDPRFKQILRDVGLIDFFRATGKWNDFCQPLGKDDFECH